MSCHEGGQRTKDDTKKQKAEHNVRKSNRSNWILLLNVHKRGIETEFTDATRNLVRLLGNGSLFFSPRVTKRSLETAGLQPRAITRDDKGSCHPVAIFALFQFSMYVDGSLKEWNMSSGRHVSVDHSCVVSAHTA